MKVVILCGGKGTRLREETDIKPKPMVLIGGKPIIWHIMKGYSHYGFNEFILCLGYKGDVIKDYFLNYDQINNDFTLNLGSKKLSFHNPCREHDWTITFAETGENTMTGTRIKRIEKYIGSEPFMLTYGDGIGDIDLHKLLEFHQSHGKIGTVTGVRPASRFGELVVEGNKVKEFSEKSQIKSGLINGGFFAFNRGIFDFIDDGDDVIFEREPLEHLTQKGELRVFKHGGFWQCMDTYRDYQLLNNLWAGKELEHELHFKSTNGLMPPWKVWSD
jgi:glucose-1-phosphate cytidylyltransferase